MEFLWEIANIYRKNDKISLAILPVYSRIWNAFYPTDHEIFRIVGSEASSKRHTKRGKRYFEIVLRSVFSRLCNYN